MNLFAASHQWANRPNDERFWTLPELHTVTHEYAMQAREANNVAWSTLRTEAVDGEVTLVGKASVPAKLTHYAFGQLATKIGAPASYLRELPATLAVQNLNHGLKLRGEALGSDASLLLHKNGSYVLRAITSDRYTRIWNHEVAERLLDATDNGWRTPPGWSCGSDDPQARAATAADVIPGGIVKLGEMIRPTGLYASDHDMFVFLVNEDRRIMDGTPGGLARGIFVSNSEVGAGSLKVVKFLYRYVCGNNIVWGAKDVKELSVRHIGNIANRQNVMFELAMNAYADESASDQEAKIRSAQTKRIATTKEKLLDVLFGNKRLGISRKLAETAYDACLPEVDGDPLTFWGYVQGATRASQNTPYADVRAQLDRSAAQVLEMAF